MKPPKLTLYRHRDCQRCNRISRFHAALDWFHRLATSTDAPPTGPLRMGEVVVEDHASGRILRGTEAFRIICRQIPLYYPLLVLAWIPAFRRMVDREMSGCKKGACQIPEAS